MDITRIHSLTDKDGSRIDFNDISLESMGAHLLFGEIDTEIIKESISFVLKANMLMNNDITIFMNTVGGDCSEGFALIDVMEASRLKITTVGLGNIMSMGVLLVCAGTKGKRIMMKNTAAMAHQFASEVQGKFHELVSANKSMVYTQQQFMMHFLRHTKMNEKQINDIMFSSTDRYLSAAECKKFGIIDQIVDELPQLNIDLSPAPVASVKSVRRARR